MKKVNIGSSLLKIVLATTLLLGLGGVAFLSLSVQPETQQVTKTLDNSQFEQAK